MAMPFSYAREQPGVRAEIVRRIAAGERLRDICAEAGMPCQESVTGWARRDAAFGTAYAAAKAQAEAARRGRSMSVADEARARTILDGLAAGRRIEDIVRGPDMPSWRTYMAWRRDHGWFGEAVAAQLAGRRNRRSRSGHGRWRPFDPAVGEALYVRLWKGEGLRAVLRSDPAFPSLMVLARWRREHPDFDAMLRSVTAGWRKKRPFVMRGPSKRLTDRITDQLATGASLRELAAQRGMPCARTLYRWCATRPDFAEQVERAHDIRDWWYDDLIIRASIRALGGSLKEVRAATAPLVRQQTRLKKRPGWKRRRR